MVSTPKNAFPLLALLALAASAFAFTVEEEASFFAREGEQASAVEFDGHYMVLVNGVETAVLKKSGEEFLVLQNPSEIEKAMDAYSEQAFEDLQEIIPQVVSEFNSTRDAIDKCLTGSKWFSFNLTRGGVYVKFNVRYDRFHFPKEWGAIWFIHNNSAAFEKDWNIVKQGVDALESSGSDEEKALSSAKVIRESFAPVKAQYPEFYEAYLNATSSNPYAYRVKGVDSKCDSDANVTAKIDAVLALVGPSKFDSPSALKETVKNRTKERAQEARQNKIKTGASATAGDLASQADALARNFSAYGIDLKKLKTEAENLRNAVGRPEFENQSQALAQKVERYKTALTQYLDARVSIQNAEQAIQNASQRFGPTDGRIADYNTQLQNVKIALREGESALGNGNIEIVDMAGIGQNATVIAANVQNLQPRENEIDFVTIGVLLLVVLAIAGGAYYLYKKRQPPSYGLPAKTPSPKVSLQDIEKM
ncbi:MAG: hypothetical protein QXR53_00905 [Candidatus Norongarragalinales archaeon]